MPTHYGRDISCTTTLRTGRFVKGARLVGEAAFRRLTTSRGTLRGGEEEANYGLDLVSKIGTVQTAASAAALEGEIRSELTKDERIIDVTARVTPSTRGPAVEFDVEILAQTTEGPFTLQIHVDEVTAQLVGLVAEGEA